jgi:hypothetical protein
VAGAALTPVFTTELVVFCLLRAGIALLVGIYTALWAAGMNAVVALKYE